jgi:ATP-binding cassette subfamily B protein
VQACEKRISDGGGKGKSEEEKVQEEKKGEKRGGAKEEEEKSSTDTYFRRAVMLVLPHWPVLVAAMLCLLVSVATQVLLPSYQGKILDAVIQRNEDLFHRLIVQFIGLSLVTGLTGGLRRLLFNVMGRQISYTVRNQLFAGILAQPISFFDGASTGDLTARLTGDAQLMVTPVQRNLSTFLQSALTLLGSMIMCFVVSWRLSLLAFTTVAPAMYITQTYAKWSATVNKQIRTELGDANGAATEALVNIRTVKAFSTEQRELRIYERWNKKALVRGLLDAVASAGTTTLNSYLDLGGSVIVLWYGGLMVLHTSTSTGDASGAISVGGLVTFNLYWNRINSSFSQVVPPTPQRCCLLGPQLTSCPPVRLLPSSLPPFLPSSLPSSLPSLSFFPLLSPSSPPPA